MRAAVTDEERGLCLCFSQSTYYIHCRKLCCRDNLQCTGSGTLHIGTWHISCQHSSYDCAGSIMFSTFPSVYELCVCACVPSGPHSHSLTGLPSTLLSVLLHAQTLAIFLNGVIGVFDRSRSIHSVRICLREGDKWSRCADEGRQFDSVSTGHIQHTGTADSRLASRQTVGRFANHLQFSGHLGGTVDVPRVGRFHVRAALRLRRRVRHCDRFVSRVQLSTRKHAVHKGG